MTTVLIVKDQAMVSSAVPFTATYTMNANCTGKEIGIDANNNPFHLDEFVGPNGNLITECQTDPGLILCGTENRDSGK